MMKDGEKVEIPINSDTANRIQLYLSKLSWPVTVTKDNSGSGEYSC